VEVLLHGHARERLRDLKAARDAKPGAPVGRQRRDVPPREDDPAIVGTKRAGHAADERRLARAVRSDEPEALTLLHVERQPVERGQAAEALHESVNLEQRRRHQRPRRRRTRPRMPSGASTTKATSTTPTMKRFISEEIVTMATWEALPSSTAPMTGPTQL